MKFLFAVVLYFVLILPSTVNALTTEELVSLCGTPAKECLQSGFVQMYLGGAADALIIMSEEMETPIFCSKKGNPFPMDKLREYIVKNQNRLGNKNAALAVFQFLQSYNNCQ